ncbi:MAG: EXLDI protein [Sporolactobacillus sp.]
MPNKTIYVPDSDLQVFDDAQQVSGKNLSATIVHALRFYTKIGEGRGFAHIEVSEGESGTFKRKRFIGRELASAAVNDQKGQRQTNYVVYETAHGRYAVFVTVKKKLPLEESVERELERRIIEKLAGKAHCTQPLPVNFEDDVTDIRRLEIFQTLDALAGHVPDDLLCSIREIRDGEFLDI